MSMPTERNAFQLLVTLCLVIALAYTGWTIFSTGKNLPPVVAAAVTSRMAELEHSWSKTTRDLTTLHVTTMAGGDSKRPRRLLPIPNDPSNPQKRYYESLAWQDAIDAGIPPDLFVRQINQESGFNTGEMSPAGAVGIAQFLPSTAAGLGVDPWDPVSALRGAARLMANYQHNYGDYRKALAAYNGGSGTLGYCLANYGPTWLSCEPSETQNYIRIILNE